MATDKRGITAFPHVFKLTSTANWIEVQLPSQCNQVTVYCHNHDVYVGFNDCTDGGAVNDNVRFDIDQNVLHTVKLGRGNSRHTSIFISASAVGSSVKIMLIE